MSRDDTKYIDTDTEWFGYINNDFIVGTVKYN